MTRSFIACAIVCLTAVAAVANPKVDSAIGTFKALESDPGRLGTFCALSDASEALGDADNPAAEAKIDGYLDQLGPEFEAAWDTVEEVDENSADGQRLSAALDSLDEKCPD